MKKSKKDSTSSNNQRENFIKLISTLNDGITSSRHILSNGDISPYFIDFDLITNNPDNCIIVGDAFVSYIRSIRKFSRYPPNLLGFIEKDGIGTTGAIRFASDISKQIGLPNLTIRNWKDVPCEKIKISSDVLGNPEGFKRLSGKNVLLVSDVSTSGTELWKAIKDVRNEGGNVYDIILYFSRLSKGKIEHFANDGINIYPLILPSSARYVAYDKSLPKDIEITRMRDILLKADQNLWENGLLIGNSPIISKIVTHSIESLTF